MTSEKKIDLFVMVLFPFLAYFLSIYFQFDLFKSILVFFVLPAVYLSYRKPEEIKKTLIFSSVAGIPLVIISNYISSVAGQRLLPDSILYTKLFRVVSFEAVLYTFSLLYLNVIFYKYFLDKGGAVENVGNKMKYLTTFVLSAFALFVLAYFRYPEILDIPYFYAIVGFVMVLVPILIEFIEFPGLIYKFFLNSNYFFFLLLAYELAGVKMGWWIFPGKFLGWVSLAGISFPVEEFFFWIILSSAAILTYYEFFDDDEK